MDRPMEDFVLLALAPKFSVLRTESHMDPGHLMGELGKLRDLNATRDVVVRNAASASAPVGLHSPTLVFFASGFGPPHRGMIFAVGMRGAETRLWLTLRLRRSCAGPDVLRRAVGEDVTYIPS